MTIRVGVVDESATRDLRRTVLRPHLPADAALPGDDLPFGVHIGAVDDDGTMIGTCFVFPDPCPWRPEVAGAWHLRQMATALEHRGQGVGTAVLAAAVDYVGSTGASLLWCHARESAVGFYAGHGFEAFGEIFIDPEHPIPHLRMYRELSAPAGTS